ncbi:MAG TPA: ATP-binding protein [Chitinophagales bacterium]|nr:ATP-binding protein [Chitinophagales bacterium]
MSTQSHTTKQYGKEQQYLYSVLIVLSVVGLGYAVSDIVGYRVVAFMLLVTVSILAMLYEIVPVLVAAVLSALLWDFFFIPPKYTFSIGGTEDQLLLLMYFIIALLNAVLTNRIRKAEKKLRKQKDRENAVKFYNTLLNSLSHELRTPITAIMGAADNLQANLSSLSKENRSELIEEIAMASSRLNDQVENLLGMSRLEAGIIKPKKDWCDVNELIYSVLNRFPGDDLHKIEVSLQDNLPLFSLDFVLMQQVLYHIINNAMLYTPPFSTITIKARHGKEASGSSFGWNKVNDKLIITIADDGPGFPEEEITRVFEKFYRLHGAKSGGTGLGLSIVKGFTELQGGKVKLENLAAGGAKFTIEIPCEISYVNALKNE